jgi:signal transduction histidine kinase
VRSASASGRKKSDNHVVVCVIDHGIGIAKKDIPHLFDRFYRTDESRSKTDASGYGLGLSIAKKIVDKHQGVIKVQSQLGKGSIFSVKIPLQKTRNLINI